jgi:secreted trypsin-like serine protease
MRHILVVCCLLAGLAFPAAASAVVRGTNVPAGDAPYAVALLAGASSSAEDWQRVVCGGSIVDARTVLTAAHCAARVPNGGGEVLAGRTNLLDTGGQRVRVESVAIHPGFDAATFRDDVALLRLASPVRATPVALGADAAPGSSATVLGWGALAEGQRTQTAWLQAGSVPVLDDAACVAALTPGFDPETQLCAGAPGASADACQGDSGGPLVVGSVQVGVVSDGRGCGRSPGIYTRLASPAIAGWLASALTTSPSPQVAASSDAGAQVRQHPVVQDVRRLGPRRFQISGYVTNATRATRVHVQRRVGHRWVVARRAARLSADGRFRVVVRAPRWPRLRVMVVGSGGSRPAARR